MPTSRPLLALVALAAAAAAPHASAQRQCGCMARGAPATQPPATAEAPAAGDPAEEDDAPFAPSPVCALCHSNAPAAEAMRDPRAREVSPFQLWRGTAMASAFRDVIWRAAVAAEVAAAPRHEHAIVAGCIRCHGPMGARTLGAREVGLELFGADGAGALLRDGVSCTVCHRISADGLGDPSTFGGAFRLVPGRQIVGPHPDPFPMPMLHHTGFEPVQGDQILSGALCGTCHTVVTTPLGAARPGETFLEQAPYLEWRNSVFGADGSGAGATCQACHLPVRSADGEPIETRIARNPMGGDFPPIDPRSPYGRHVLVGGNTLLPALLAAGAPADDRPAYAAVEALAAAQLARRSARLEIVGAAAAGGTLSFVARVENLAGHKFPTGHPSRRAWLRVRVRDAGGRLLFASGEHDRAGRLVGPGGRPLASERPGGAPEPHRATIRRAGEVQVYELAMEDRRGEPTDLLLRAARPRKDDRLLPAGWSADHADAARTRPVGTDGDADFVAGGDGVAYELPLPPGARRPLQVEAELLYQPLSPRLAAAYTRPGGRPARALAAALARHGNAPTVVAADRRTVE